jgi:hypothetical protein
MITGIKTASELVLRDRWHVLYRLGRILVRQVLWVWNAVLVPSNYLVIANFFKLLSLVTVQWNIKGTLLSQNGNEHICKY